MDTSNCSERVITMPKNQTEVVTCSALTDFSLVIAPAVWWVIFLFCFYLSILSTFFVHVHSSMLSLTTSIASARTSGDLNLHCQIHAHYRVHSSDTSNRWIWTSGEYLVQSASIFHALWSGIQWSFRLVFWAVERDQSADDEINRSAGWSGMFNEEMFDLVEESLD